MGVSLTLLGTPSKPRTPPDNKDLVLGSGEFMVAWLTLMKKLIDVKQVTESSHSLPSQTVPPSNQYKQFEFEPIHFLAKSHKVFTWLYRHAPLVSRKS